MYVVLIVYIQVNNKVEIPTYFDNNVYNIRIFKLICIFSKYTSLNRRFASSRLGSKIIHIFHIFVVAASP